VIYVDSDIYFYQDFNFLFDELDHASILLTPHWRNAYPLLDEKGFYSLFTDGIFNAGFIGADKGSEEALTWWAEACHFKMGSHRELGIQDDQRYLDIFPVRFDGVKIIKHKGCNVSGYNKIECKRQLVNGEVLINGVYPIIFIHYNKDFIAEILKGYDDLLLPYFKIFKETFEEEGIALGSVKQGLNYYLEPGKISKLKWKLKVRTRIKALLTRLAEII
jgi:hypothetical protein